MAATPEFPKTISDETLSHTFLPTMIVLLAASFRFIALADVPPGVYYDESANGVDALRVLAGAHPLFFVGDQGREPLTTYLQALAFALLGPSPFALRLPSAFLGILTVAATYATFRSFAGRSVGLIGATLLAISFWHVALSRLAFRAIALPLFATLAIYWLWKGIRTGRVRYFALGGAFLGVDLYTYIPARLAPVLIGIWLVGCAAIPAWRRASSARRVLLGSFVVLAILTIVAFPLGRYFYLHPADFAERLQNVASSSSDVGLLDGFGRAVDALVRIGDPNSRQDLPGRPLIDLSWTIVGILGLGVALRSWRDGTSGFIVVWCLAMLAPAALTDEPAHALRLSGLLPFVLLFPALGLAAIQRLAVPPYRQIGLFFVILVLLGSGVASARDYFLVWASQPDTLDAFQSDLVHALVLDRSVPPGALTFATADVYQDQPIPLSFFPAVAARVRSFDGRNVFVVPSHPVTPVYYLTAASFQPAVGLDNVASLATVARSYDVSGRRDATLLRLDPPFTTRPPDRPIDVTIGSAVQVTGVDLTSRVAPGQTTHVALHWTVRGELPPGEWQFFGQLIDRDHQQLLADDYNFGFPPSQWRPGDQVTSWFTLRVPADAPALVADVSLGLFDRTTGRRLDLTSPSGAAAGNALSVGPVRVDRPRPVSAPTFPLALRLGSSILLDGYDLAQRDNGDIAVTFHWHADRPVTADYTVFVHIIDANDNVVAGADAQPGAGAWPTSSWGVGDSFVDEHVLPGAASTFARGRLQIGMYLLSTGDRLPITDGSGQPYGNALVIGS